MSPTISRGWDPRLNKKGYKHRSQYRRLVLEFPGLLLLRDELYRGTRIATGKEIIY